MTRARILRVFHRTTTGVAADIRIMGFHDSTGGQVWLNGRANYVNALFGGVRGRRSQ